MHELAIAQALLERLERHVPGGARLRSVHLRAGPLRALEPEALEFAWRAVTPGTAYEGSTLELEVTPWTWRCGACGEEFASPQMDATCPCGSSRTTLTAGDELVLLAVEIDEPADAHPPRGSAVGTGSPGPEQPCPASRYDAPVGA